MAGATGRSPGLLENFAGVAEIMMGREAGLKRINGSADAFWWSFVSLLLAALIDTALLSSLYGTLHDTAAESAPAKGYYVAAKIAVALLAYAGSMVALYLLCRSPQEQARFALALATHNWAAPLVSVFVAPFLLATALGNGGDSFLVRALPILLLGCLIIAGYRLIRISLDIPAGRAAFLFIITALVSLILGQGLEGYLGLAPTNAA